MVTWRVTSGGSINVGTGYGGGHGFHEARRPGKAVIDAQGRFVAREKGTVTITATGVDDSAVKGRAIVGIGAYPGVNPRRNLPLRIGANSAGQEAFRGDIDRIRLYSRVLTAKEVAAHAAGKGLDAREGLLAEWTFDRPLGSVYPNTVGKGLAAKVKGPVLHVPEGEGGYVRLGGQGYLEVANDKRLDVTQALTMEAWVRPKGPRSALLARQTVWMWGFVFHVGNSGMMVDGLRWSWQALETGYKFDPKRWTHVVGILGPGGLWQLWADGKLLRGYQPRPTIIDGGE